MTKEKFVVDLYLRVSTDRQVREGDSLEEQENELKKFCEFRGFHIHQIYIEKGKSGGNTNRPEYQKLIKDVEAKKIDAVIVKKLDRLSRSLLDFENLMTIMQKNEVEFISIKESFDTTNALGKAMLRVALVFAQLEREQTSERLIDVLDYRASQGLYNGGIRPYGYTNVNKELIPYKKEKDILEVIFKTFVETESTTATQNTLNEAGFRNRNNLAWDKRGIHNILNNPIYIGKMRWKENIYQGIHPPIISEELFNKVKDIFTSRRHIRNSNKIGGLLRGHLFCACGSEMKPNYTKKRNENMYYYYRCSSTMNTARKAKCGNKYLNMITTNQQIIENMLSYSSEANLKNFKAKAEVHNKKIQKQIIAYEAEIDGLEKHFQEIKSKQEKYLDSLISHQFTQQERQLINSKLGEFSLQEKQIKGQIYKQRFELSKKVESLLSVDQLKKALIFFKINYQQLSEKELKNWFYENVSKIIYQSEKEVVIYFKLLDDLVG
ncbi:recombinase family protein [Candidatus Margulisiibacteriota bacterium]